MDTLKQLQEKGEGEFKNKFFVVYDSDISGMGTDQVDNVIDFLNQQTTLAFEAGKAEERSNIINEITTEVENYGYTIGITNIIKKYNLEDTLKTKLTAKE